MTPAERAAVDAVVRAARVAIERSEQRACSIPFGGAAVARQVGLDIQSAILALAEQTETPPNPAGQTTEAARPGDSMESSATISDHAISTSALPGPETVSVPVPEDVAARFPGDITIPKALLAQAYRGLKRHYEMPEVRREIDRLLAAGSAK